MDALADPALPELSAAEYRRFGRHLVMPEVGVEGQRRLKAGSILLIGAGGLGCPAALYLAAAGVGRIGLVDADVVEETNLQRQIAHGHSTLGRHKSESAAARMHDLNPDLVIERHDVMLTAANALGIVAGYDVVIDGTDNFAARYLVNDACVKLGKPNVFGGVLRFEGQLSVFDARQGPCYRCLFPEPPPPELAPNCAEAGVLGVLPGVIGTLQATEALKLLAGIGTPMIGRMLLYDGLDMSFSTISMKKNPHCPVCSKRAADIVLTDLVQACAASAGRPLTPAALKARLDAGADLVLVDVRRPEEWRVGTLGNALLISKAEIDDAVAKIGEGAAAGQTVLARIPRDRDVVLQCRSGARSNAAIAALRSVGYDPMRLYNLEGGMLAWSRSIDPLFPV